jgi:hypothetical protein
MSAIPSTHASTEETGDFFFSISFKTKPCDTKQTSGINEVTQYCRNRRWQFVVQHDSSLNNGWCLNVLIRPEQSGSIKMKSIASGLQAALDRYAHINKQDFTVHKRACQLEESRVLDQSFCQGPCIETRRPHEPNQPEPENTHVRLTAYTACQIVFSVRAIQRYGNYDESATAFGFSLGILKESLVNEMRRRASEATIDAFKQEGQGCGYTIRILCQLRNPVHHFVVRRIVGQSIKTQETFRLVTTNGSKSTGKARPKIFSIPIDAVRQSYISPPPENGERWLHHSLVCSKAHDMPFTEFVEELGKTVKREESNLLGCYSWEQYKTQAWAMQVLLFSIHKVLLSKCLGSGGLPLLQGTQARAGHDSGVGTANDAAVAVHPSLPSNAESSTTLITPNGASNLNSTNMSDAAAADPLIEATSRKLLFHDDAPAPVETPVPPHRDSPSGNTVTETGITATQFFTVSATVKLT